MSVKDKASFILVPSRYKANTIYPYRGTVLDTFVRSGSTTRYDEDGNLSTVSSGVPSVDFRLGHPELVLEQNTTNLLVYSTTFSSSWAVSQATATGSYGISPTGGNDSVLLTEDSTTSEHQFLLPSTSTTSGVKYSFSVFAKKAYGSRRLKLKIGCGGGEHRAIFDLDSKKVIDISAGATSESYVEDWGNGWLRCVMVYTSSVSGTGQCHQIMLCPTHTNDNTYLGDGVSSLEIYGAQLEAFNRATSYIPTTSSAASRTDNERFSGKNIYADLNNKQGTIYIDYKQDSGLLPSGHGIICHITGTGGDELQIGNANTNDLYFAMWRNGTGMLFNQAYTGIDVNDRIRVVASWDGTVANLYLNGKRVNTAAMSNVPTSLNELAISYYIFSGGYHYYTRLKEMAIFTTALSEDECVALSSFDSYDDVVDRKGLTWGTKSITDARMTALRSL